MINTDQIQQIQNASVHDGQGDKIGSVGQVYLDDETGRPEWVTVKTGLFGTKESFVPLDQAEFDGENVRVPFDKDKVKDAPRMDADQHLNESQERDLYRYYGRDYGGGDDMTGDAGRGDAGYTTTETAPGGGELGREDVYAAETTGTIPGRGLGGQEDDSYASETAGTAGTPLDDDQFDEDRAGDGRRGHDQVGGPGHDTSGPNTDDAMTRSEERLQVGTEARETGRVRLRKYVVTENQTQTVPVSREEVRVEREPITDENRGDATSGPSFNEEEHEVTLHEERPVVSKEEVPVERVRLSKETVQGEEQVSEDVRKEQVETDGGNLGDDNR